MSKWRFLEPWLIGLSAGLLSIIKQPQYGWLNVIPVLSGCFLFLLHRSVYEWIMDEQDCVIFLVVLLSNIGMFFIPIMFREWVTLGCFVGCFIAIKRPWRCMGFLYYVLYLGAWCALALYSIQALG